MDSTRQNSGNKARNTDRRTKYTIRAIQDAYIDLLQEKGRNKIHISDVCKLAEINRCTFYLHYESLEQVETQIMEELTRKFSAYVNSQKATSQNRLANSTLFNEQILHNESFLTMLKLSQPDKSFQNYITPVFKQALIETLPENSHLSQEQISVLYHFISGGCAAVQSDWIQRGNADLPQENAFLDRLVHLCMAISPE